MEYWWVNHSQTFKEELNGGYIWSPTKKSNGSFNQTYDNLTLARVGDLIFSYSRTYIKAIGIIESNCLSREKPAEFESPNNNWGIDGYFVKVNWRLLPVPLNPKTYINDLKGYLPVKHSPIQKNGNGNQACYLAKISPELSSVLLSLIYVENKFVNELIDDLYSEALEEQQIQTIVNQKIPETEKNQLIKSRIGQGIFKTRVIDIEKKCRVTGVDEPAILIASHIKPWRDSSNFERLDGNNGLLLSPHVDKLFDKGWITFSDLGDLIIANRDALKVIEAWQIPIGNTGSFNEKQVEYLIFHRNKYLKAESCADILANRD
jgi:putative restriction endonuclease